MCSSDLCSCRFEIAGGMAHGAGGVDLMNADEPDLKKMTKVLARFGTTTFLPTLRCASSEKLAKVIARLYLTKISSSVGARMGGVHLEGPMLNPRKRGIHPAGSLSILSEEFVDDMISLYGDFVKIITLAPELDKDLKLCQYLYKNKIIVSLGHSEADFNTTQDAIEKGLRYAVHTFNAMPTLHHRNPGPLGALLTDKRVSCEIIVDGRHVHSSALKILYLCKGADKIILVTDAVPPWGTKQKQFTLERKELFIRNGVPMSAKGVLAGSIITLPQAAFFFARSTSCPLSEAVNMASLNPARIISREKQIGSLEIGKKADILVTDASGKVEMVFIDGIRLK